MGRRPARPPRPRRKKAAAKGAKGSLALATWKQLIDLGSLQDGADAMRATARRPVALLGPATYDGLGLADGGEVTVTGDRGAVTLPARRADDLVDGVVWVPANSFGNGVLADLASPGSRGHGEGSKQVTPQLVRRPPRTCRRSGRTRSGSSSSRPC